MQPVAWTILIASICWIVLCYLFLFRKRSPTESKTVRDDKDVIAFTMPILPVSPDTPVSTFATSVLESGVEQVTNENDNTPTALASPDQDQIKDEDLIDIRTLSLDLTYKNQTS